MSGSKANTWDMTFPLRSGVRAECRLGDSKRIMATMLRRDRAVETTEQAPYGGSRESHALWAWIFYVLQIRSKKQDARGKS